jgi:hypothetical protein
VRLTVWLFASGLAVATLPEAHPGDTGAAYWWVAVGVLGSVSSLGAGLWLTLVGWFIVSGARAEQAAAGDERLAGLTAAEVMTPV